jgi:hypothetical protein
MLLRVPLGVFYGAVIFLYGICVSAVAAAELVWAVARTGNDGVRAWRRRW